MNGPFTIPAEAHTFITLKRKAHFILKLIRYHHFTPVLEEIKSSFTDWTITNLDQLPSKTPPDPCSTVELSSHRPELSCGFIIGRDGKQNHHRMRHREKGGKASNKIHADLQIEKVRERKEEDSPSTKPCAHRIQHHPSNEIKKEKQQRIAGRQLIALLLYLLGYVANDFHIVASKAFDTPRKEG